MKQSASGATCAVIGAGLGGCAVAARMALAGYRMRLHDLDDGRLKDIRGRGGIEVDGLFEGFAAVEMATPELAPAVDGADVLIVCTGSNAHAEVARLLSPLLTSGQTILLVQGGTAGSLVVQNELRRSGCSAEVDVSEMDNYPFSLAWPRPTSMSFTIRKEWLQIAALPAARGPAVAAKLRAAFPQAVVAPNTLYTGLNNANGILHVANMVSNIGRLEATGNGYRFYAEGYTPSAIAVLEQVDAERLAVARALGVTLPTIHEWPLETYRLGGDTLAETFQRLTFAPTGPYQWTPTPRSMQHKYITEDVPCGLVPMAALGDAVGVATPVIDGLVALTSAMVGRDFAREGRSLQHLGLAGRSAGEVSRLFELGPDRAPS